MIHESFPKLPLFPNDKTMLDGLEVDIAIPSLAIGIEWNGIVHFRPIYGLEKLTKIQQKDKEKLEIAQRKAVNLIVVPDLVSNKKQVTKVFNEIKPLIAQSIREKSVVGV